MDIIFYFQLSAMDLTKRGKLPFDLSVVTSTQADLRDVVGQDSPAVFEQTVKSKSENRKRKREPLDSQASSKASGHAEIKGYVPLDMVLN